MASRRRRAPRRLALAPSLARGGPLALAAARAPPAANLAALRLLLSGGETAKVNILREGSDPPVLDDAEYPDWLWTVHEPLPSLQELTAKFEADPDSMTSVEHRRMTKLWNRARIKDKNAESAKS